MTTTSPGVAATVAVPAATPALPAGHDRCRCGDLASVHDIGVRKGVKVRTACACGSCDCRGYQPAEPRGRPSRKDSES